MRINDNSNLLNAWQALLRSNANANIQRARIATGLQVISARDNGSGLAVSEGMRAHYEGMEKAIQNAQIGISATQVAEEALGQIHDILARMRELSVQAENGTYTDEEKKAMQQEINQLNEQINDIAKNTEFNIRKLFGGDELSVLISSTPQKGAIVTLRLENVSSGALGTTEVDLTDNRKNNISVLDEAMNRVSDMRSNTGAIRNRLTEGIRNLEVGYVNQIAAESSIRDADIAQNIMNLAKKQILSRAATLVLVNQNINRRNVLSLLMR